MAKKSGKSTKAKKTLATKKTTGKKPASQRPKQLKKATATAAVKASKPAKKSEPTSLNVASKPEYKTLRLQKRIKHPVRLPSVWKLTKTTAQTFWRHKKLFLGITAVYGLLNLTLAQGLAGGTDVATLKDELSLIFSGNFGAIASSLSIFVVLVGSAGNSTSQTAGAYQVFLALISSLAVIWALRQVRIGSQLRVRDAYYRGMYPLVPFILVLVVIGIQLVPAMIGSALYSLVVSNGIAVYFVEKLLWALLYGALALLSLYMLSSSLFALYIVTLPDMTPIKALRSARELVRFRRWTVLRKLLFLPVLLLIGAAVIMLPIIILVAPMAQWAFFILTMFSLIATHSYIYNLYRELLNE